MDPIIKAILEQELAAAETQVTNAEEQVARFRTEILIAEANLTSAITKRDTLKNAINPPRG